MWWVVAQPVEQAAYPSCRRFKSCQFTEPEERSLRRSTDQFTGSDAQRNVKKIENIYSKKRQKFGNSVVAEWQTMGDLVLLILSTEHPNAGWKVHWEVQVRILLTLLGGKENETKTKTKVKNT